VNVTDFFLVSLGVIGSAEGSVCFLFFTFLAGNVSSDSFFLLVIGVPEAVLEVEVAEGMVN
jgi:hypothetical protein